MTIPASGEAGGPASTVLVRLVDASIVLINNVKTRVRFIGSSFSARYYFGHDNEMEFTAERHGTNWEWIGKNVHENAQNPRKKRAPFGALWWC
jgi:hypothetical protein